MIKIFQCRRALQSASPMSSIFSLDNEHRAINLARSHINILLGNYEYSVGDEMRTIRNIELKLQSISEGTIEARIAGYDKDVLLQEKVAIEIRKREQMVLLAYSTALKRHWIRLLDEILTF